MDGGVREPGLESGDKLVHRLGLSRGTRIFRRYTVICTTAHIGNADGIGVVTFAVCPDMFYGPAHMHRAVAVNNKVITDVVPTVTIDVPVADLRHCEVAAFGSGSAV